MDAINSYKTFLMRKGAGSGSAWTKLVDVKTVPELMAPPEALDKTTLSDPGKTYIPGISDNESMEFTTNYNKADFDRLKAMEDEELELAVWFGGTEVGGVATPTGSDGKFEFKGFIFVGTDAVEVNKVVDMKVSVFPTTAVTPSASS